MLESIIISIALAIYFLIVFKKQLVKNKLVKGILIGILFALIFFEPVFFPFSIWKLLAYLIVIISCIYNGFKSETDSRKIL